MQILPIPARDTFWLPMGYNFDFVIASDTLFDSRGGFRFKLSDEDIAEIKGVRDVVMETAFETALAVKCLTGDNGTGISYNGCLVFSTPTCVGRSFWFHSCGGWYCSRRATVMLGIGLN